MAALMENGRLTVGKIDYQIALSKSIQKGAGIFLSLLHLAASRVLSRFKVGEIITDLGQLGKKHGPYFLAYAICIEVFEDIALPAILYSIGKPHLIPVALAFHCEPIAYPLYFAVISAVKRFKCR